MSGRWMAAVVMVAALVGSGCSVQEKKSSNGNEDVKIETPLGGMKVKTNDSVVVSDIGIAAYPGATVVKQDKDNGAADVDMSFGGFHLGVKAVSYLTPDSQEKVLAFYRKELSRYGDVIECKGVTVVGKPTKTSDGLTCENDNHISVRDKAGSSETELKTGSKSHQRIVALEPEQGGTKIGLVLLDLPKDKKESN